jgi:hypothetical protein
MFLYIFQNIKSNCVHILRKIQTTMMNLCVQTNEILISEVYFFKKRISMVIIEY